jgi:Amt family ammonium transporter
MPLLRLRALVRPFGFSLMALILSAVPALAADDPKVSAGDTAWVLTSSALVLLMTAPGLALFYAGMVRRKNVLATLMQSFIMVAIVSVQWVLFGYSLAFSPFNALIGGLSWMGLSGVSATQAYPDYAGTIPHQAYMVFQCMFAVITPALITGAFAERISFRGFLVFSLLWTTLIYDPLAHWVWGVDGWIHRMGALDFAGGTVVHISSGVSALAAVLVIGRRHGYPREPMVPHNLTLTITGAGLLWFGWFGFNAGSALSANGTRSLGLRGDPSGRFGGNAFVGDCRVVENRQTDYARRSQWSGCWPRCDNAGLWIRRSPCRDSYWWSCWSCLPCSRSNEDAFPLR